MHTMTSHHFIGAVRRFFAPAAAAALLIASAEASQSPQPADSLKAKVGRGYSAFGKYMTEGWKGTDPVSGFQMTVTPDVNSVIESKAGRSLEEFSGATDFGLSISGSTICFDGEYQMAYGSSYLNKSERSFVMLNQRFKQGSIAIYNYTPTSEFLQAITNAAAQPAGTARDSAIDQFFTVWGTHLVTQADYGIASRYYASVVTTSDYDTSTLTQSATASFNGSFVSGSASANMSNTDSSLKESFDNNWTVTVIGGDSTKSNFAQLGSLADRESMQQQWIASNNDPSKWELIGFQENSLIPLWTLPNVSQATRDAVEARYNARVGSTEIGQLMSNSRNVSYGTWYYMEYNWVDTGLPQSLFVGKPVWSGPNSRMSSCSNMSAAAMVKFTRSSGHGTDQLHMSHLDQFHVEIISSQHAPSYSSTKLSWFQGHQSNVFIGSKTGSSAQTWTALGDNGIGTDGAAAIGLGQPITIDDKIRFTNVGSGNYLHVQNGWTNHRSSDDGYFRLIPVSSN